MNFALAQYDGSNLHLEINGVIVEPITDEQIQELKTKAETDGDADLASICNDALTAESPAVRASARQHCAKALETKK